MSVYTIVTAVKDGRLSVVGWLEGPHGIADVKLELDAGRGREPYQIDDIEFMAHVITADSPEDAEAFAIAKYTATGQMPIIGPEVPD